VIENKKTLRKADIVFGLILFFVSGFFLIESLKMVDKEITGTELGGIYTSPGILPATITIILMILALTLIISAFREGAHITKEDFNKIVHVVKRPESIRMFIMALIIIGYVFGLLGRVPFIAATFIYLAVFMYIFKAGKLLTILIIAGITSFLIAYSFGNLVQIPLP